MKIGTPSLDDPWQRPDFVDEGHDYFINAYGAPQDGVRYHCPCCGYPTLRTRGSFELCPVCAWEDDGQDSHDADRMRGGPNGTQSLAVARASYAATGTYDPQCASLTRPPSDEEKQERRHDH